MKILAKFSGVLIFFVMLSACSGGYVELFDGKTLDGWECNPPELASEWRAENGEILGENVSREGSILWTTKSFRDFEVELEYMTLSDDYDSGLFLRGESHQVQIGISRSLQEDLTGCIYAPVDEQGSYPGRTDKVAAFHHVGAWNHLRVIIQGKHIRTFLNGEPFVDYEAIHLVDEGPIGLQLHGGVQMEMKFKNISLRELSQNPVNEN